MAGRFRLDRMLGQGGYGAVFIGEQTSVGRRCAVKVLVPDVAADPRNTKRFEREAKATSQLAHPNTVVIYDFGLDDERQLLFIAMEYIEGESLRERIERERSMPLQSAVHITYQAASSLGDAHQQGLVHRDVKPHNIMVTERGGIPNFVKVIDFGIAKFLENETVRDTVTNVTATGMVVGTPAYMSPEQVRNGELDPRTDQYSLAVCVYQMLTGRTVFVADSPLDIATKHIIESPLPVSSLNRGANIPPAVDEVLLKALSKDPDERFSSIQQFADELVAASGVSMPTSRDTAPPVGSVDEEIADTPTISFPSSPPAATRTPMLSEGGESEETAPPADSWDVRPTELYRGEDADEATHSAQVKSAPTPPPQTGTHSAEVKPVPEPSKDDVRGHTVRVAGVADSPRREATQTAGAQWAFEPGGRPDVTQSISSSERSISPAVVAVLVAAGLAGLVAILAGLGMFSGDPAAPVDSNSAVAVNADPIAASPEAPLEPEREAAADAGSTNDASNAEQKPANANVVATRKKPVETKPSPTKKKEPSKPTTGRKDPARERPAKKTATKTTSVEPDPPAAEPELQQGKATVTLLPWGELWVDGKNRGTRGRQTIDLTEGKHRFELRQNGEVKARKTVDVVPGENTMIELIAR